MTEENKDYEKDEKYYHNQYGNYEDNDEVVDHFETQEETPIPEMPQPKRKSGVSFRSGFIGGVAGGILAVGLGIGVMAMTGAMANQGSLSSTGTTTVKPIATATSTTGTTDVSSVVAKVKDAVVSVINKQAVSQNSLFGTNQNQSGALTTASEGSGVIYKVENGYAYIVTNNHVISGQQELEVLLADGTRETAELVGADKWTDLAVLKIKADKVTTVAEFGNSDDIQVGQTAIAIGSPLGSEFATSVTQGIISAKDRSVATDVDGDGKEDWVVSAIQTDAAINPGNSGGALINAAGQVIGINSMKISQSSVEGMGFAIPSNEVVNIINQLEKDGKITRPVLGISMYDLASISSAGRTQLQLPADVTEGVVVMNVQQGSSAANGGLQQYDVITEMDGQAVSSIQTLRKNLYNHKVGDSIKVTYYRNGQKQTTTIQLTGSDNPSL